MAGLEAFTELALGMPQMATPFEISTALAVFGLILVFYGIASVLWRSKGSIVMALAGIVLVVVSRLI